MHFIKCAWVQSKYICRQHDVEVERALGWTTDNLKSWLNSATEKVYKTNNLPSPGLFSQKGLDYIISKILLGFQNLEVQWISWAINPVLYSYPLQFSSLQVTFFNPVIERRPKLQRQKKIFSKQQGNY